MPEFQYSPKDIEQWQSGAARFLTFANNDAVKQELNDLDEQDVGPLKLLFLGEKPAIAFSSPPAISAALKEEGFRLSAKFVYNPGVCAEEISKHRDLFGGFSDVEAVFAHLDEEFNRDESSIDTVRAGVMLGFPRKDSEAYQQIRLQSRLLHDELKKLLGVTKEQLHEILLYKGNMTPKHDTISGTDELVLRKEPPHEIVPGLSNDKVQEALQIWRSRVRSPIMEDMDPSTGTDVNVHGMAWVRFGESEESRLKEERLRASLRLSGILNGNSSSVS